MEPERIGPIRAFERGRMRVEKSKPAAATTRAQLMITADHEPGRGGQERRCRLEEICQPSLPVIAMRAAGASLSIGRTCRLAVIVIADMDHQIGLVAGRTPGNRGKWPSLWIVAVLDGASLEPAAGVADYDDPPHLWGQDRSRRIPDNELAGRGRRARLAHRDREGVVRTHARRHREVDLIRRRLWTSRVGGYCDPNRKSAVGHQLRPWSGPIRRPRL